MAPRTLTLICCAATLVACQQRPSAEAQPAAEPAAQPAPAAPSPEAALAGALAPPADAWWEHPDTACPEGASLRRVVPPEGNQIWCALPDGTRHGRAARLGALGNLINQGEYRNGVKQGTFTSYHPNGTMAMRVQFAGGVENGPVTTWHPNGAKALEGEYRDGKGYGAWTKWDADGNVIGEGHY